MAEAAEGVQDDAAKTDEPEVTEKTPETTNELLLDGKPFDPDRAMQTILNQREEEARLKAELAKYRTKEEQELEEQKSLEQKLLEREQKILELESREARREAETTFKSQAKEAGIADPDLALLVAEKEGLIGAYDPKTGTVAVDKVDFDKLIEDHPVLAADIEDKVLKDTGDAGRISRQPAKTLGQQFSEVVRGR